MRHILLFLLLFVTRLSAVTALSTEDPVKADGEYSFPAKRAGNAFTWSLSGTFGGGTATIGYINAAGAFTSLGRTMTTAGSFTAILPQGATAGQGVPAVSLSGSTSPSISTTIVKADASVPVVAVSDIQQSGATSGQVPTWNGSAWTPVTPASGTSPITGTDNTFIFEGDSITQGAGASAGEDWPTRVMETAMFSGKGTKYNVAQGGAILGYSGGGGVYDEYTTQVYPRRPIANGGTGTGTCYLFLLIGTNDTATVPAATWLSRYESYLARAKADGFVVVACTITPGNHAGYQDQNRVAYNYGITKSLNFDYLVDFSAIFYDHTDTSMMSDGLHPTALGYKFMARAVETALLVKRKTAGGDVSATRMISGPLQVGNNGQNAYDASTPLAVIGFPTTISESTKAARIRTEWTPSGSSPYAGIGLQVESVRKGSNYGQDLVGVASTCSLQGNTSNLFMMTAFDASVNNQTAEYSGTSTVSQGNSFRARTPYVPPSGVMTTAIGLFVNPQKTTGVTNGYGIYAEGTADSNVFAGKVKIGAASNPSDTLDVTGGISLNSASGSPSFSIKATSLGSSRQWYMAHDSTTAALRFSNFNGSAFVNTLWLGEAGNASIGTSTPNASAILDLQSTTKAFLLPRMTKTQRDAISSPAAGMAVYQTDNTPGLRVYNGTNWMRYTETAD